MAFEVFSGATFEPTKRHRSQDERKVAVIKEAFAALKDGNYTEVARRFVRPYYLDSIVKDELSVEYRNQIKNVAKKIREFASTQL